MLDKVNILLYVINIETKSQISFRATYLNVYLLANLNVYRSKLNLLYLIIGFRVISSRIVLTISLLSAFISWVSLNS